MNKSNSIKEKNGGNCVEKEGQRYSIIKGYEFEDLVRDIFEYNGYKIVAQNAVIDNKHEIDIIIEKSNKKYIVEVKYYRKAEANSSMIIGSLNRVKQKAYPGYCPILVTSNALSDGIKRKIYEEKVIVIDVSNLLYMIRDNPQLKAKLLDILQYSTQNIINTEPTIELSPVINTTEIDYSSNLIEDLTKLKSGKKYCVEYERQCLNILHYLFEEDLSSWNQQYKSNEDLYRFDLVCKIKSGNVAEFWETVKGYFNSKYIIFEFKNYTNYITQKEIYTTEKYLYSKALRGVAIIITRKGIDSNGLKASKGVLRESGKLIIVLNDDDVYNMIKSKVNNDSPADYLAEKLDNMLLELEK